MVNRFNTNNPRPSNSMKDLSDNALAYDDFINSDADEAVDRFNKPFPTVRKQVAVRIDELVGASQNAIESAEIATAAASNVLLLSKLYTNVSEAQAEIEDGIILINALFNVSVPAGAVPPRFADQYQNIVGVATPTGVSYPSQEALNEAVANINSKLLTVGDPSGTNIWTGFQADDGSMPWALDNNAVMLNEDYQITKNAALSAAQQTPIPGNDYDINFGFTAEDGSLIGGFKSDGEPYQPIIESRIVALERGKIILEKIIRGILSYGQSNAGSDVQFGQEHRVPMSWGVYPPGYTGELDGDLNITIGQVGTNRTLHSSYGYLVPLTNRSLGETSDFSRGVCDWVANKYPGESMIAVARGVGGQTIEYLNKPTPAEITVGNSSGIVIGTNSAEYLMLQAGQNMSHILSYTYAQCATPYYGVCWWQAKIAQLVKAEGNNYECDIIWKQGEADNAAIAAGTLDYKAALYALYDTLNTDIKLATRQKSDIIMYVEQSNYSDQLELQGAGYNAWVASGYADAYAPGGASSSYTTEQNRVNTHFPLNLSQQLIGDRALSTIPARAIYVTCSRYPFTSRIHMHPHAQRGHGEQIGKIYAKTRIEGQNWQPMEIVGCWYDITYIYLRFNVPVGNCKFITPVNARITGYPPNVTETAFTGKAGKPHGLEHSAGNITAAVIMGDVIRLTTSVVPAPGQTVSYLNSVRIGDLCDEDETASIYTDRNGTPNSLRNYCIPFKVTL